MPYESDAAMPAGVKRGLSAKERTQWRAIFNSCHTKNPNDEAMCFKMANGVVKGKKEREESDDPIVGLKEVEIVAADGTKSYQYVDSYDYAARAYDQSEAGYNPVGGGPDKACSNCRFFVSPARCAIVNGDIAPNGVSDMWDAVPAYDPMANPMPVQVVGFGSAGMKELLESDEDETDWVVTEGIKLNRHKMPESEFAYIDGKGGKHLPIHDAKHVKLAMGRFDQTTFESDSAKATARRKIVAAAKKFGIDVAAGDNVAKKDLDEASLAERISAKVVGLVKSLLPGTPPETPRVLQDRTFATFQAKDGRTRFIAVMTNNFKDREGETFTEEAHKEYVDWAEKMGPATESHESLYPELWLWHTPDSRIGQADWLDYSNGFVVASGWVDGGKEAVAEKLAQQEDVGVSHGFVCLKTKSGEILKYRSYELSPLPLASAANEWTSFNLLETKENEMPFSDKRREWLANLVGEETVKTWEASTESMGTKLKELGVEFKSKMEDEPAEVVTGTDGAAGEPEKPEKVLAAELANVSKSMNDLVGVVAGLKGDLATAVEDSKKSRDTIMAEELKSRSAGLPQGHQASTSDKSVVAGDKAKADTEWFGSQVIAPILNTPQA